MFKFTIFFLFIFVNHRILVSLSQRLMYMAIYILFFPIITWKWKCFTLWCHFLLRKKVTFHCGWLELVNFLTPRSRHGAGKVIVPGSMMRHMFGSRKKVLIGRWSGSEGQSFFRECYGFAASFRKIGLLRLINLNFSGRIEPSPL